MSTMKEAAYEGEVTWLGLVPEGIASDRIHAEPRPALDFDMGGARGEHHYGETRASCVRVTMLYAKGTRIRNVRQVSILAQEDLDTIAERMGLDRFDPAWLGASIVLRGIPDLSHVPPSSRLQSTSGLTLTVDMENLPCVLPGREIEREHPGFGKAFKPAAAGRRGVTAWVEHPGSLSRGDRMRLFVPTQPPWSP
ncbi:MOSC domain-containing protein [Sedimentitalea sp. XS_ASV28]|uniref:MOSC domain-containing protein n=1 Tax=Sedimentitalea sp. XS_ASV28 TaxID=3241296 RepID=UPI003511F8D0